MDLFLNLKLIINIQIENQHKNYPNILFILDYNF